MQKKNYWVATVGWLQRVDAHEQMTEYNALDPAVLDAGTDCVGTLGFSLQFYSHLEEVICEPPLPLTKSFAYHGIL